MKLGKNSGKPQTLEGGFRLRCGLVCLLLCLSGGKIGLAEEKALPAWQRSQWVQIEAATGAMNLDGTLRLAFPLGVDFRLKQLGVRLELEHRVETDAAGRARSDWQARGLQSSLAPAGRGELRWQPLAGAAVKFQRDKISRTLSAAGASPRWLIREAAPGKYDIRSLDGKAWRYEQGCLTGAENAQLGRLRFFTQGALVRRIIQTDAGAEDPPLFEAAYNETGRLISYQIGSGSVQRLTWNGEGQLVAWQRADANEMRLSYRDGLLSLVEETGKPARQFTWRANPGFGRGDSRWMAPVHLASDGENAYSYEIMQRGFVLGKKDPVRGTSITTTFNPRRRRVAQEGGGSEFLVIFRGGENRTALERIEVGGKIMEQYIYDEHDQLVGIRRHGEPERRLSYDESGRLMAFEEDGKP